MLPFPIIPIVTLSLVSVLFLGVGCAKRQATAVTSSPTVRATPPSGSGALAGAPPTTTTPLPGADAAHAQPSAPGAGAPAAPTGGR